MHITSKQEKDHCQNYQTTGEMQETSHSGKKRCMHMMRMFRRHAELHKTSDLEDSTNEKELRIILHNKKYLQHYLAYLFPKYDWA